MLSYLKGELAHVRKHWLSCLLSCVFVHLVYEFVEGLLR